MIVYTFDKDGYFAGEFDTGDGMGAVPPHLTVPPPIRGTGLQPTTEGRMPWESDVARPFDPRVAVRSGDKWVILDKRPTADSPAPDQEKLNEERVSRLWTAAHEYEYAQISGSAIGMLAMGVMRGLPKCISVQQWIKGVWVIYYERKESGDTSTDFSGAGLCPFSVPEMMAEMGL